MKKNLMTLVAVLCCMISTTVFTACTSDNEDKPVTPTEPEQLAEYTILYYAHGGGNLDDFILSMIADFYKANPDAYKKVNVVVQYKFSKAKKIKALRDGFDVFSENYGNKTIRWAIDPAKTFLEQASSQDNIYGDDNADITCPDSLTNFINWAAKAYPAKKYMLIMNDHGRGYVPHDELPERPATRGMIYDNGNNDNHFTAKSFHRAVANANVRFETIYLLACLMNNLEYQFEIQDLCDYVIASTYTMPADGNVLNVLPEQLSQSSLTIEQALATYSKALIEKWDEIGHITETTPIYTDLTVTRTANIRRLGEMMRQFTDRLCNTYSNGTERQKEIIDSCTAQAVKVQSEYPYYDVAKYMSSIIKALPEVYGDEFFNQMKETFNSCLVTQNYSKYLTVHDYMVDYSVMLGTGGCYSLFKYIQALGDFRPFLETEYCSDGSKIQYFMERSEDGTYYRGEPLEEDVLWGSTLADTYEELAFDRAVGWSRWLRLNRQLPNNLCPSDMHYELPMPE